MVLVPNPHEGHRVARELSDSALIVIKGPDLNSVLVGGLILTVLLAIPYYGVWCSVIALTMAASAYGEIIRRVSRGPTEEPDPSLLGSLIPRSIPKLIACSLLSAGTVVPLWLLNAGSQHSPHFDWIGRTIVASTWMIVPLLMLSLYARTEQDAPLGFRICRKLMGKHRFATFLALAVVPITFFLIEIGLGLVLYLAGYLTFFTLDFMPIPLMPPKFEQPIMYNGIPHYNMVDYRTYPPSIFYDAYFDGLMHGYSFVAALPASLSMSTRAGLEAGEAINLPEPYYLVIRILLIVVIVTSILAAFAIQARWLGSIPALERKKRPV